MINFFCRVELRSCASQAILCGGVRTFGQQAYRARKDRHPVPSLSTAMTPSSPAGSQRELLSLPTEVRFFQTSQIVDIARRTDRSLAAFGHLLPCQILLALAGFLPPPSLCAFSQTCTAAYELLSDDEAWSAWQGSYLVTFDDPRDSGWRVEKWASGKGGRDWRFLAQQCFKAVRLLVGEQLDCDTQVRLNLVLRSKGVS